LAMTIFRHKTNLMPGVLAGHRPLPA